MIVDVISVPTPDGLELPAAFLPPQGSFNGAADAVILNGGTSASFYSPPLFGLMPAFAAAGLGVLSLATRGRDIVWKQLGKPGYYGSAFESIADCIPDFNGAIEALGKRGFSKVVVIGHSNGAVKAIYYAAHEPDRRLTAVVSCSGPRFSAAWYAASDRAEEFRQNVARAQALVDSGQPDGLFELTFPTEPLLRSAQAYLDKYTTEAYNFAEWSDRIRVPLLRLTGEREGNVVQAGVAEDLMRLAVNSPQRQAMVIPGAAHRYSESEAQFVADATIGWLQSLAG
ncbi:MAG: alpha/beta fold hydrolase [Dehalococcoidia bacterium]